MILLLIKGDTLMLSKHFLYPLFSSLLFVGIISCDTSESPEEDKIIGEIDTEMGGDLEVTGVVLDNQSNVVSNVFVTVSASSLDGSGEDGMAGSWELYTDRNGKYSFTSLDKEKIRHIYIWFNGGEEYGEDYENCGYYFWNANLYFEDTYTLNIVVYPVTNSGIIGEIMFVDSDGMMKNLVEWEDSVIELNRGTSLGSGHEYTIGSEYGEIIEGKIQFTGLAGGTYFFIFQFTKTNGQYVDRKSSPFNIPLGETLNYQFTVE
jgi:hypothetical protein